MASLFNILLFLSCFHVKASSAIDNITAIQFLKDPETLVSPSGNFKLGFFSPPNSTNRYLGIRYNNIPVKDVLWVANRNNPLKSSGGVFKISKHGSLQVLNGRNRILWSSNVSKTTDHSSSVAKLLDSGNLVLYRFNFSNDGTNGTIVWQSFEHPTDTVLRNMRVTITKNSDMKQALRSWKSPSDPSEGRFSVGTDSFILPQLIVFDGDRPHWRSGPWNGNIFIGVQYDFVDFINAGLVIEDDKLGTLSAMYSYANDSLLAKYVVNYQGTFSQLWWDDGKQNWEVAWQAPENECDLYGKCGEFGSCNARRSPICQCLKGFEPTNKEEWNKGNWTNGCVRKTQLQCNNASGKGDGFLRLTMMKVPDYAEWSAGLNQDGCRSQCLNNCSCLAYAYDTGVGCMAWSRNLVDVQEFSENRVDLSLRLGHSELHGSYLRWRGVDLYLRLAHSEYSNSNKAKVIIPVSAILGTTAIAILAYFLWWCMARRQGSKVDKGEMFESNKSQANLEELPLFKFEALATATKNFHESNKLGQGGFGPVYKGNLRDGREIAVKRFSQASQQGAEEFMNEVVVISKLQHRNLVQLFGCCVEGEGKMLIYEYMPNGSLDAFVFDPLKQALLNWKTRFNIIEGICRGLLYLHRDSRLKIIHRDLKAGNILLDEDLNPKISDFGMARICSGNQDQENTKRVVGTYCYMSPEYAMEGQFSEKSDVYSFGVLLLEIVSGIRNSNFWFEEQSLSLLGYAWTLWNEENIFSFIDPTISDPSFMMEIVRCVQVGLLCVQELAADRPSIGTVISMLGGEIADLPNPKKPGFMKRQICSDNGCSQEDQLNFSTNYVSITEVTGR